MLTDRHHDAHHLVTDVEVGVGVRPDLVDDAGDVHAGHVRGSRCFIISWRAPILVNVSVGLTAAARTAMRTSPGPACRSGSSKIRSISGPPYPPSPDTPMTRMPSA